MFRPHKRSSRDFTTFVSHRLSNMCITLICVHTSCRMNADGRLRSVGVKYKSGKQIESVKCNLSHVSEYNR